MIHINSDTWEQVNQLIESEDSEFKNEYITDMFELLSDPPLKEGTTKESRMYCAALIVIGSY